MKYSIMEGKLTIDKRLVVGEVTYELSRPLYRFIKTER